LPRLTWLNAKFSDSADGVAVDSRGEPVPLVAAEAHRYEVDGEQTSHEYAGLTEIERVVE
jgi:hypothetical protein